MRVTSIPFDYAHVQSFAYAIPFLVNKIYGFADIKVRIREIPVLDKLQYLHVLLSSVLPVVKQIHREQCFEVELEKKLRGKMYFKVYLGLLAALNRRWYLTVLYFFLECTSI